MTSAILRKSDYPRDARTGLILPLSKSLGSQDLAKHRAVVAVELEVMAKKMDRFGWERDRGSAAHDRLVADWMDALQDYPLEEVQAACRDWVRLSPRKMPNEGDILGLISKARHAAWLERKARMPAESAEPPKKRISPEEAQAILEEAGFAPKRMGNEGKA